MQNNCFRLTMEKQYEGEDWYEEYECDNDDDDDDDAPKAADSKNTFLFYPKKL